MYEQQESSLSYRHVLGVSSGALGDKKEFFFDTAQNHYGGAEKTEKFQLHNAMCVGEKKERKFLA